VWDVQLPFLEIIAASLAGKETEQSLVLLPGFQGGSLPGFCVHSVAGWQRRRKNHNRCFGSPYCLRLQRQFCNTTCTETV